MNRYSFLSLPIREELTKRITSVCKSFGLEDLYYDSFTRRYGMNEECEGENGLVNDHVKMNEE